MRLLIALQGTVPIPKSLHFHRKVVQGKGERRANMAVCLPGKVHRTNGMVQRVLVVPHAAENGGQIVARGGLHFDRHRTCSLEEAAEANSVAASSRRFSRIASIAFVFAVTRTECTPGLAGSARPSVENVCFVPFFGVVTVVATTFGTWARSWPFDIVSRTRLTTVGECCPSRGYASCSSLALPKLKTFV